MDKLLNFNSVIFNLFYNHEGHQNSKSTDLFLIKIA